MSIIFRITIFPTIHSFWKKDQDYQQAEGKREAGCKCTTRSIKRKRRLEEEFFKSIENQENINVCNSTEHDKESSVCDGEPDKIIEAL